MKFVFLADQFPEDISWKITRKDNEAVVMEDSEYPEDKNGTQFDYERCVEDTSYLFELNDAWKDGLCCKFPNQGEGYVSLYYNGESVFENKSEFTSSIGPLQFGPPL